MRAEEARADYLATVASYQKWLEMSVEDIADVNPRIDKSSIPDDLPVSFVPMPAVGAGNGSIHVEETRPAGEVKKGFTAFLEGDVLFAKITPCMENGKMAVVPKLVNGFGFGSTEFHVLRPSPGINAKYLYYYVSSQTFRGKAERHMTGAVGQRRVPTAYLKECRIPVAPLDQQERIVAEIEKQFSRLDEAVANLKRVKANLKRYKAAVLKAAVEGKLTEEWRKAHPDVEPASKLLDRILAERRAKWEEAELAKMGAKGKAPANDKWKAKYKEPALPEHADCCDLPEGWVWASVDQLAAPEPNSITDGPFGSNLKTEHYQKTGPRVIRLQNIKDGEFADEYAHISVAHFERLRKHEIQSGDLVIATLGDNPPRACILPSFVGPAVVKADCIRFKPHPVIAVEYLNAALNSQPTRQRVKSVLHGIGRPRLSLGEIRGTAVPLAPAVEQQGIVTEVERRFSLVTELEAQVDANLMRAECLRQSILRWAFAGKLTAPHEESLEAESELPMVAEPTLTDRARL